MHLSDKNVLKIEYKKKSFAINKFYRAISSIFYNVIFFFWENMKQICTAFIETSVKIVFLNFLIRTISLFTSISVHSPVLLFYIKFFHTQTVSIPMKTDSIDLFLAFSRISLLPIELPFSSQLKTIAMRIIQSFNQYISLNQYKLKAFANIQCSISPLFPSPPSSLFIQS